MSRVARHLLTSMAMVLLFPHLAAAQAKDLYQSYMISAAAREGLPNIDLAESLYARAIMNAPSTVDRIEAQLRLAGLLSRHLGGGQEGKQREQKAESIYQAAIAGASGEQRLRARNDYGVFLFRCGGTQAAADVFGQIAQEHWPGPDGSSRQARLLYNYGQVLERNGRAAEAMPLYLESMRLDVRFSPSRDAAQRLAEEPAAARLPAGADPGLPLLAELLDQKRSSEAEALLLRLADRPERLSAGAGRFADLFLRYLTEMQVEPAHFSRVWEQPSKRLQQALAPAAAECIGEVRKVYGDGLAIDWQPHAAAGLFPCWSQADRVKPFSRFLKETGDAFAEADDPRKALERYSAAASLSPADTEAALDLGNLLVEYRQSLDPQGELLARFARERAAAPAGTGEPKDLEQLVFLHSLLAADAQKHKRLGPEDDPLSAVYQWQRALEADAKLAAVAPEQARPRPAMLEQLAASYEGLGDWPNAAETYRAAARGYVSLKEPDRAESLIARAEGFAGDTFSVQADGSWQTIHPYPSARVAAIPDDFSSASRTTMSFSNQRQASASRVLIRDSWKPISRWAPGALRRDPSTKRVASLHPDPDLAATGAQTAVVGSNSDSADTLPDTASPWPGVGLAGLLSLAAALAVRRVREAQDLVG